MRMNLPVTNVEIPLEDGKSIVSKTDLRGDITYVNPYFVEISGYSESELMGAPQNLIRHPDMPAEAFADLWRTVKKGKPWTGLVKNRSKSGNFYWVRANITPVRQDGQIIGYMSVRTKPDRKSIEAASNLYAAIRQGKARGLKIHEGHVVKTGLMGIFDKLRGISMKARIHASMGFLLLLQLVAGVVGMLEYQDLTITSISALAILFNIYFWCSLLLALVKPLNQAIDATNAITGGDLSGRVETNRRDETGQLLMSLRQMNINLTATIGDVRNNVASINAATNEIAAGNNDLSHRTESQAANLEETSSSMEELTTAVKNNAENALKASTLAETASSVAEKGAHIAVRTGQTMEEINASSKRIVDIISLIDSIAFQTNILALNAAVEAARAGEQGRGFAVVASEVRGLAQRSAGAAKEIKTLIEDTVNKVSVGNQLMEDVSTIMQDILDSVAKVTDIMGDITRANQEQTEGINMAHNAITQIDDTTQQNAALVEQAASAATHLNEQTHKLMQAISIFKLQ